MKLTVDGKEIAFDKNTKFDHKVYCKIQCAILQVFAETYEIDILQATKMYVDTGLAESFEKHRA